MSKTDNTNPTWIKLLQNPEWREEVHDHRDGICDIELVKKCFEYPRYGCGYGASDLGNQHVWCRSRRYEQIYRKESNGKARNNLRMDMQELRKMTREDIEDCEFLSYPHRHQALWDAW